MKCHACGQENDPKALFCIDCRRPLVAPAKAPTRLEPLAVPNGGGAAAATMGTGFAPGAGFGTAPMHGRYAAPAADVDARGHGLITEDETWRAIIGDSNAAYYLVRFSRLARGESASWHWPGALVTWYWMLHRKMWGWALAYFLAPFVLALPMGILMGLAPRAAPLLAIAWWVGIYVVPGMMANRLYFNHCQRLVRSIRAQGGTREQQLARMEARGGTGSVVIVIAALFGLVSIIGILAAIALPAYQTYTVKAKVSEAVRTGAEISQAVGREYASNGTLPADIDRVAAAVPHRSPYVQGVHIDAVTGALTIDVDVPPKVVGSLVFVPAVDAARHLSWSCATDDLTRFVPADCRHPTGR